MPVVHMADILGIHHMTAISGPGQENLDFYTGVLGLRLVKLTVNFDDPSAYHLYYGDRHGSPGSILTFFPYPNGRPGRPGTGQATVTSLCAPAGSLPYWVDRFRKFEVDFDRPQNRYGAQTLPFRAPDGLLLEIVATPEPLPGTPWTGSEVPEENALVGMRSVVLVQKELAPTEQTLVKVLGFRKTAEWENRHRYEVGEGGCGRTIDVVIDPTGPTARSGHGSVHHVAFRIGSEEAQCALREELIGNDYKVSNVRDRDYFRSIYFREPGGVLFEVATDQPGFTVDEPESEFGTRLMLPKQFELHRRQIERVLPPLNLPAATNLQPA